MIRVPIGFLDFCGAQRARLASPQSGLGPPAVTLGGEDEEEEEEEEEDVGKSPKREWAVVAVCGRRGGRDSVFFWCERIIRRN